ncbi:MAG: acyl-CoA dehydrogenase [Gammaproteobacteria bacterium]|nr:acyl-CoA dehydrogenase [Gammaproteobacteria bacterium]
MSALLNRRDLEFLLYEFLEVASLCDYERYAEHDRETFDAVLEACEQLATEQFLSHAAKLDENEPQFDGEQVHIIPEVKQALDTYCEAGYLSASFDAELGGMQLPWTITQCCNAIFAAANVGTVGYGALTVAAANMLNAFGTQTQKDKYLPAMLEGRFFGTMCLSEPHAGSSLADIRTKAEPQEDGSYLISGTKMWISGGDHDLSENIVHMVLAKIPGGPPGIKGISLFVVPRTRMNEDGTLGETNDVHLTGLNHKMGWRGTVNTVLSFGEDGDCRGYLLGEKHKGMSHMFHMLNEARILVGLESTALAYTAYLYSLDYAHNRPQGRHADEKDPNSAQVAIIEHADVRRMLLKQKAYVEGALGLLLYGAHMVDQHAVTVDEERRREIGLLLDLLTPVMKAWPSEYCLEANKLAIQVLGGYGYTRDYPVERLYRDNRLNAIHDGTSGIQGLDLLGRKVVMYDGEAFQLFIREMNNTLRKAKHEETVSEFLKAFEQAIALLQETTNSLIELAGKGESQLFLANSTTYIEMFGHITIAWVWLQQAMIASKKIDSEIEDEANFYQGKIDACRFFYRHELPKIEAQANLLQAADDTFLRISNDSF